MACARNALSSYQCDAKQRDTRFASFFRDHQQKKRYSDGPGLDPPAPVWIPCACARAAPLLAVDNGFPLPAMALAAAVTDRRQMNLGTPPSPAGAGYLKAVLLPQRTTSATLVHALPGNIVRILKSPPIKWKWRIPTHR